MKLAYVAGPFRGPNAWEIECNIRRAEELALEIWRQGVAVICPHTNTRFFQGAAEDSIWLEGDLEMLRRCDMMFLAPNWLKSSGARAEIKEALRLNLPIYEGAVSYRLNPEWLRLVIAEVDSGNGWAVPAVTVPKLA